MTLRAALAALLLVAAPAAANDKIVGVLGKTDHRVPVEPDKFPWSSVGRVNREGGFCTGTLIAPREVLTAAHCLYDTRLKRWVAPHQVHFVAGYARGDFRAHAVAARFVFAPGHTDAPPKDLTADWVVITLAEPIGLKPIEVEAIPLDRFLGAVEEGELTRAGYGADRAHLLSMHRGCTAVAANPAGIVFHRCDSNHGDSGSPLLLFRHGVPTLVGIHVAIVKHGEEALGAAVPAASFAAAVSH